MRSDSARVRGRSLQDTQARIVTANQLKRPCANRRASLARARLGDAWAGAPQTRLVARRGPGRHRARARAGGGRIRSRGVLEWAKASRLRAEPCPRRRRGETQTRVRDASPASSIAAAAAAWRRRWTSRFSTASRELFSIGYRRPGRWIEPPRPAPSGKPVWPASRDALVSARRALVSPRRPLTPVGAVRR
jgi:hypothetical protein